MQGTDFNIYILHIFFQKFHSREDKNTAKLLNENEVKNIQVPLVKETKQEYLDRNTIQCNSDDNCRNPFAASCIIPLPGATPGNWVTNYLLISIFRHQTGTPQKVSLPC